MDFKIFFLTFYEVCLSLFFGLVTVTFTKYLVCKLFLDKKLWTYIEEKNTAACLFIGTMVICMLMLCHGSILPSVQGLQAMWLSTNEFKLSMILLAFVFFLVCYGVAYINSAIFLFIIYYAYCWATSDADEHNEIEKNNLTLSILLCMTIIGMTAFIRPGVTRMMSAWVPYDLAEQWVNKDKGDNKNVIKMRFNTK